MFGVPGLAVVGTRQLLLNGDNVLLCTGGNDRGCRRQLGQELEQPTDAPRSTGSQYDWHLCSSSSFVNGIPAVEYDPNARSVTKNCCPLPAWSGSRDPDLIRRFVRVAQTAVG
jgi:hypothetical protein